MSRPSRRGRNLPLPTAEAGTDNGADGIDWTTGGIAGGTGVTSLSKSGSAELTGDVTLTGGTNVTLTQSGQDISIAASGGGTLTTKDEGTTLSTGVTTLDFVGAGVTASGAGATTTVTISGGGGGGGGGTTGLKPIQDKYTNFGNTSSGAITMGSAPTSGNILYLCCARDNGAGITSVTQTNVTWTQLSESTDTVAPKLEIWKGVVGASAGTGITVAYADGSFSAAHVSEWASTVPDTFSASVILAGAAGANQGGLVARPTGTILVSGANDLVLAVVTGTSNATRFWPMTGMTNFDAMAATTDAVFMCAYAFPGTVPVKGVAIGGGGTSGSLIVSIT